MAMSVGTGPVVDPFDAGPYLRWQAALGMQRAGWSVAHRAVLAAVVAWVPLVVLAAVQGLLLRPNGRESLLLDATAYSRYLVAVPILVAAERLCLPRLSAIARNFAASDLIAEPDRPRYEALIAGARRMLDHRGAEVVLVVIAYAATIALSGQLYPSERSTWVAPIENGVATRSLAGWWRLLVSQPLFLLLVGAWFWRIAVWTRFLWGVSRLDLRLVPSHPDLTGGLFFLSTSLPAFGPVAMAFSATFAGAIAEAVLMDGHQPSEYRFVVAALVAGATFIFAGPLLVFQGPLRRARARGIFSYGVLAAALGRRFEERWIGRGPTLDPESLEVPDFSATIDLYSVVANVRQMRVVPVSLHSFTVLLIAMLGPYAVVAVAVLPAERLREVAGWLLG